MSDQSDPSIEIRRRIGASVKSTSPETDVGDKTASAASGENTEADETAVDSPSPVEEVKREDGVNIKDKDLTSSTVSSSSNSKAQAPTDGTQPPLPRPHASRSSTYANTKTVAQGFLNMSLLSANAGQLKTVLIHGQDSDFYYMLLGMIITSMVLQLVVSIILALKYFIDFEDENVDEEEKERAIMYNNVATVIVMFVSALNVIISVFSG
ncbi:ninjurin-2-like [Ptychodera flava]|uniref:ninjurin-2-like n=1 Tax=Ptychodera flava TaxID=63121 RepID=UPI00396A649A